MKQNINFLFAILLFTTFACGPQSPYDTSTPEKFITALGQVGERPKEENPIPYFYAKEDAIAITTYDEAGGRVIGTFQAFKTAIAENFPDKIKTNEENKIVLEPYKMGPMSMSFSLSASIIRDQIQGRKASDYKFISATDPDENDMVEITFLMLGNESKLEVTKFGDQYMMTMTDESIAQLNKMVGFFNQADEFFTASLAAINNKEITGENLMDKATLWEKDYISLLNMLN